MEVRIESHDGVSIHPGESPDLHVAFVFETELPNLGAIGKYR
jgi:hypothetical protein